eukprot:Filipodium_phascolosomae@DN4808_c0_g1_i1.p1
MIESVEPPGSHKSAYVVCCDILRRSYIPPLMDSCQDIAIIFKCPKTLILEHPKRQVQLLQESQLCANSFHSVSEKHTIYTEILQAKIDALMLEDDAYLWILARLGNKRLRARPLLY